MWTTIYPFQVRLDAQASGLRQDCKAQAEQVRSVAVERPGPVLTTLPPSLMAELGRALRLYLAL